MKQEQLFPGEPVTSSKVDVRRKQRRDRAIIEASLEAIKGYTAALSMLSRMLPEIPAASGTAPIAAGSGSTRPACPVIQLTSGLNLDRLVTAFCDECLVSEQDGVLGATVLYKAFQEWFRHKHPGRTIPTQHAFGKRLKRRFLRTKYGWIRYVGVAFVKKLT